MARFRFSVKDEWGRRRAGSIEAPSLEAARKRLLQSGYELVSVVEDGQSLSDEGSSPTPARPPSKGFIYTGALLVVLAGFSFAWHWLRRPIAAPVAQPVRLTLEGQVNGRYDRVVLDLPELPYHEEQTLKAGKYRFGIELKVQHRPTYAWLQISAQGALPAAPLGPHAAEGPTRIKVDLLAQQDDYQVADLGANRR